MGAGDQQALPFSARSSAMRLRRLYRWLTYKRLTIIVYGASFWVHPFIIIGFLGLLALIFAPYVILVLYREGRRGWSILMLSMTGIPIGVSFFLITNIAQFPPTTWFFPLVMFYFYCVFLRWAVAGWIADSSPGGLTEVQAVDGQTERESWLDNWI